MDTTRYDRDGLRSCLFCQAVMDSQERSCPQCFRIHPDAIRQKIHVEYTDLNGVALLASWPTGVVYECQCGGTSCRHEAMEGFLIPISGTRELQDRLYDFFTKHYPDGDFGTECADFIDECIRGQFSRFVGTGWLQVDRARLVESTEGWVFVRGGVEECAELAALEEGLAVLGIAPPEIVLVWENSD